MAATAELQRAVDFNKANKTKKKSGTTTATVAKSGTPSSSLAAKRAKTATGAKPHARRSAADKRAAKDAAKTAFEASTTEAEAFAAIKAATAKAASSTASAASASATATKIVKATATRRPQQPRAPRAPFNAAALALFGVSHARAAEIVALLPRIRELRRLKDTRDRAAMAARGGDAVMEQARDVAEAAWMAQPALTQVVDNGAVATCVDNHLADTDLTSAFLQLVARASNGRFVALHSLLPSVMEGGVNPSPDFRRLFTPPGARHLDSDCIIAAHVPGHFFGMLIQHTTNTLVLIDPTGAQTQRSSLGSRGTAAARVVASTHLWLRSERARLGRPAVADYGVSYNEPPNVPLQLDGVSCGFFSCCYFLFYLLHNRWPTRADFSSHFDLRIVVIDAVMTGRLRAPLAGGGGGGGGGGGAGGGEGAAEFIELGDADADDAPSTVIDLTSRENDTDVTMQRILVEQYEALRAAAARRTIT